MRLIFDDLQTACSDLDGYCKLAPRPAYGRYLKWCEQGYHEDKQTFWRTRHTAFDNLERKFPVLGPGDTPSVSTMRMETLLHLPKVEKAQFTLPILGRKCFPINASKYRIRFCWHHI